eukprot:CAMPEP_0175701582 /NCGR_PEP_ID=MMETSP0097-20121207/35561_1 /TAXON_ID=311494 /ORGANISM="Alexandrium monilatum, Strain CCMP3105" /LENGTH=59 /DNA_ID=CAMNT_0017008815 /DNA_START=13 /DNA_END=190 /DNA_ORIENTATION=-
MTARVDGGREAEASRADETRLDSSGGRVSSESQRGGQCCLLAVPARQMPLGLSRLGVFF